MYGQMQGTELTNPYNGPAKPFSNESYAILKDTCPSLAKGIENTRGCCDIGQLTSLQKNLKTAATLFSRCPSCSKNFYDMWCDFTCSPDQSLFLDYMIGAATFHVSSKYANGLYDSCKDVTFPGSNGKVMDLMCGTTAKLCTTQKFLKFVGTPGNGAPFGISFDIGTDHSKDNITELDNKMFGCNETYYIPVSDKNSTACSCQDCQPSCPVPPSPPPPKPEKYILGIKEIYFITGLVLLIWILIFLLYSIIEIYRSKGDVLSGESLIGGSASSSGTDVTSSNKAIYGGPNKGKCVGLGIKAEELLQSLFQKWGTFCATHPWEIIGISALVVLGCALGLLKFTVVTNPVDLWSSPSNRARQEKTYYDEKFTPFYRTEQIIITSNQTNNTEHYIPYQQSEATNFSGIVTKEMLKRVSLFVNFRCSKEN